MRRSTPSTISTPAASAAARSSSRYSSSARSRHATREVPPHVREGWREVLHRRLPQPLLGRQPRELEAGPRGVREGLDRLLLRLPPARPARDPLGLREVPQGHARGLRARHVHRGPRRLRHLPVDLPQGLVHRGLQHRRQERLAEDPAREVRRPADRQRALRPARGRCRPQAARGGRQEVEHEGRQGLHRGVARGLPRLAAGQPRGLPVPGEVPGAGHQEHPRAQGPDDLAAGQGRVQRHATSTRRPPTTRT